MIINYIGKERCDLLYYIIKSGIHFGKTALVIDNSISNDFYHLYQKEENGEVIELNHLTVCKNMKIDEEIAKEYDLVIIYNGLTNQPFVLGTERFVIASSLEGNEFERIHVILNALPQDSLNAPIFCIRDNVSKKITPGYMVDQLQIVPQVIYNLPCDLVDYELYINLSHDKSVKVKRQSDSMMLMIKECSMAWFNLTEKEWTKFRKRGN